MKKLLLSIAAAVLTVVGLSGVAAMSPAYAYTCMNGDIKDSMSSCPEFDSTTGGTSSGLYGAGDTSGNKTLTGVAKTIINVIIGVVGFVAVAMMIMGGISFITSQGDTAKVTKARNTILYGVVGLVVAVLAFAIVNFVMSSLFS